MDAYGMHATKLGWAVIDNMWPHLALRSGTGQESTAKASGTERMESEDEEEGQ
jgi:hypothetical protein